MPTIGSGAGSVVRLAMRSRVVIKNGENTCTWSMPSMRDTYR